MDRACSRGLVAAALTLLYLPLCQASVVSHDALIYARRAEIPFPGFFDGKILYILLSHGTLRLASLFTEDRAAMLWALSALSAAAMGGAAQALYLALRAREVSVATTTWVLVAFAVSPLVVLLGVHPAHYALPTFMLALALAMHARGRPVSAFLVACVGVTAHVYLVPAALVFGAAALPRLSPRRAVAVGIGGAVILVPWFFLLELHLDTPPILRIFFDHYFLLTAEPFAPNPPLEVVAYAVSMALSLVLACPLALAALAGIRRSSPTAPVPAVLAALYLLVVFFVPSEQLPLAERGNASLLGAVAYLPFTLMKMQVFVLPPMLLAVAAALDRAAHHLTPRLGSLGAAALLSVSILLAASGLKHARLPLDETSLAGLRTLESNALLYARWSYPELAFFAQQEVRPLYGSRFLEDDAALGRLLAELQREVEARPVYLVDELLDPNDLVPVESAARTRHAALLEALETRFCTRAHVNGLYKVEAGACPD